MKRTFSAKAGGPERTSVSEALNRLSLDAMVALHPTSGDTGTPERCDEIDARIAGWQQTDVMSDADIAALERDLEFCEQMMGAR